MGEMIKLGGLWINQDKNGNEYFSGNFGFGGKINIFKNTYKTKDNDPDYTMSISAKQSKQDSKQDSNQDVSDNSDIPF